MTRYLAGPRPSELEPLPEMTALRPSVEMKAAARQYLTGTQGRLDLDARTLASDREGVPEGLFLTDREFAEAVVSARGGAPTGQVARAAERAPSPALVSVPTRTKAARTHVAASAAPPAHLPDSDGYEPAQARQEGPYRVGKLEIGGGNAVLNSQLLRSSAFCAPELGVPLPILADRHTFEIALEGVSPTQDHADVLLYAISRIERAPDPQLGTVVSFSTYQLIKAMGWSMNSRGYAKLRSVIRDLGRISLTFYDRADPKNWRVIEGERVFNSVTRPEQNAQDQSWSIVLPPSLFRIFELRRNTLVDLHARAVLQSNFGRWLHAFVSSQREGETRDYDAQALCHAGGLRSTRMSDDMKVLRETLTTLETGKVVRKSRGEDSGAVVKSFTPVVSKGWSLEKIAGRWVLGVAKL